MTEEKIIKLNLKPRAISEKRLVEIFGTPTIQKNYAVNGRFIGTEKKRVLEKASRFCDIRDDKNKKYYITKVYDNPLPSNFSKMNKELYRYICPLILSFLINKHDKNNKVAMTVGLWAREINMVNQNYGLLKDKYDLLEEKFKLGLNEKVYCDFYDRCDEAIEYYIVQALKYLQNAGLIIWRDVYFVQPTTPIITKDKIVYKAIKDPKSKLATENDMKLYTECLKIADTKADIQNAKERYYSKKSKTFRTVLLRELKKYNIRYIFKSYEAYYVNLDRCNYILHQFNVGKKDMNNLIKDFNSAFINKLVENANTRKLQERIINYADCIDDFLILCDMTINHETECLKERVYEV